MKIGRDQLIFRALAVLDETVSACDSGPVQPSIGLRFALMFLYAVSDGQRDSHDGFWRVIQDRRNGANSPSMGNYIRSTSAQTMMTGIARSVGIDLTAEYRAEFHIARMSSEERRAHRQRVAELAGHRRRLREGGGRHAHQDQQEIEQ